MAGLKLFDASPFRRSLGFQPAADPIGPYATLWMTFPPGRVMPLAVITPDNQGYPWNATVQTRWVVPIRTDNWDEEENGRRQRFY